MRRVGGGGQAVDDVVPLTGVPALALYGDLDPFASPDAIRQRLARELPDGYALGYSVGGHNVLGSECPRLVRNQWLSTEVHRAPARPRCLSAPLDFNPL